MLGVHLVDNLRMFSIYLNIDADFTTYTAINQCLLTLKLVVAIYDIQVYHHLTR